MAADPLTTETVSRHMEAIEALGGIPIAFLCLEAIYRSAQLGHREAVHWELIEGER